ncbi:large subunit ribosomal protein L25 [Natranaerovirga hydrolytica]|uniref:Large ribosomal subunit protein bL25 n=1 Tax=Natranaerovirga hydrolytica TaxID=680378 RepID=A0A4R1N0W6_9FIRM|nr:50S ribosomal protein L25 [Natranaerovirga hydrolytica]TCK98570.1 large subunit ribosomal protein L25 [Natranaerovirga hydrolytica]
MIKAEVRNELGGNTATDLREKGYIPGVIYGDHKDTENIMVHSTDLMRTIKNKGVSAQIELEVNGKKVPTIIKEVQSDVLTYKVIHADFQRLSQNETIRVKVPIHLENMSKVESNTTLVQHQLNELEIECLPKYLVESVEADVSNISLGNPLKVEDLPIYKEENINIINGPEEVIATVVHNSTNDTTDSEEDVEMPEVIGQKNEE